MRKTSKKYERQTRKGKLLPRLQMVKKGADQTPMDANIAIIIIAGCAFVVRALPRLLYPHAYNYDTYFHLHIAQKIRANLFRELEVIPVNRTYKAKYPQGYHFFLALFPRRMMPFMEHVSSPLFDTLVLLAMYAAMHGFWKLSGLEAPRFLPETACLLYAFSPAMLRVGSGPRAYSGNTQNPGAAPVFRAHLPGLLGGIHRQRGCRRRRCGRDLPLPSRGQNSRCRSSSSSPFPCACSWAGATRSSSCRALPRSWPSRSAVPISWNTCGSSPTTTKKNPARLHRIRPKDMEGVLRKLPRPRHAEAPRQDVRQVPVLVPGRAVFPPLPAAVPDSRPAAVPGPPGLGHPRAAGSPAHRLGGLRLSSGGSSPRPGG